MEGGIESLIGRTRVRFSPAVTGGILRPFPRRMHRRHRLRVPAEGPHRKDSPRTSIPACCAFHVHFQGPGNCLACFYGMGPSGEPPIPVFRPIQVLHSGDKTCTIEVQGAAKTVSVDRPKPAYAPHVNADSASTPDIPSSIKTRSGLRLRFPDYLGVQTERRVRWQVQVSVSM